MEEELRQLIEQIKPLITAQGWKMSGMGIFVNNTEKTNDFLLKIEKYNYFMEKRQEEMADQNAQIIALLKQISTKLK